MPRRPSSPLAILLAILLLLVATQAVAERDDEGDGRDEDDGEEGGDDGRRGHKHRDKDRGDDRDEDEREEGEEEEGEQKGEREGRKERKARSGGGRQTAPAPAVDDVGLAILPTALPGRAQFSFLVASAGPARETALAAQLPQTGHAWVLSGPGAGSCDLSGLELACTFHGLAAGEVQLVQAASPVARAPPWALAASGSVGADGGAPDAVPRSDAASASLGLFLR